MRTFQQKMTIRGCLQRIKNYATLQCANELEVSWKAGRETDVAVHAGTSLRLAIECAFAGTVDRQACRARALIRAHRRNAGGRQHADTDSKRVVTGLAQR